MSLVSSQVPYDDRIFYFSNSHLAPGQSSACSSSFPVVPGNLLDRNNDLRTPAQTKGKAYICPYQNGGKSFQNLPISKAIFTNILGRSPMSAASVGSPSARRHTSLSTRGITQARGPTRVMNVGNPSPGSLPSMTIRGHTQERSSISVMSVGRPFVWAIIFILQHRIHPGEKP